MANRCQRRSCFGTPRRSLFWHILCFYVLCFQIIINLRFWLFPIFKVAYCTPCKHNDVEDVVIYRLPVTSITSLPLNNNVAAAGPANICENKNMVAQPEVITQVTKASLYKNGGRWCYNELKNLSKQSKTLDVSKLPLQLFISFSCSQFPHSSRVSNRFTAFSNMLTASH